MLLTIADLMVPFLLRNSIKAVLIAILVSHVEKLALLSKV
jgi:hypothetical protein